MIKFLSSNIFIMVMISSSFIFNFTDFCVIIISLTKLPTLVILFSTTVRAFVIAKLVILSTLFLTSFILALREVVVAKLVILGISFLTSFILALRAVLVAELVISGMLSYFDRSTIYIFFNDIIFHNNV